MGTECYGELPLESLLPSEQFIMQRRLPSYMKLCGIGNLLKIHYFCLKFELNIHHESVLLWFPKVCNSILRKQLVPKQPPEVFCKKSILRNFAKFTGKHLCESLYFNKFAGLRPATLLKQRLWHRCLPVTVVKFLRTPFLQNTSG